MYDRKREIRSREKWNEKESKKEYIYRTQKRWVEEGQTQNEYKCFWFFSLLLSGFNPVHT